MIAKTKTEYEFGDCPSPHGWHNPAKLSPDRKDWFECGKEAK